MYAISWFLFILQKIDFKEINKNNTILITIISILLSVFVIGTNYRLCVSDVPNVSFNFIIAFIISENVEKYKLTEMKGMK